MSNAMAVLLQTLSARLGIVHGRDLAQACRETYPRPVYLLLWFVCEIAIAACDLAEVLGTTIGLNLLFGIPMLWGVLLTALDTLLLLAIQRFGIRKMEAVILSLISTIGVCFLIEIFLAKPEWHGILRGFVPRLNPESLYIAIGIIGATVMPHNLYLHSALVQSRQIANGNRGKAEACRFNLIDSAIALNAAFFVNAAILVMSAAVFFRSGQVVTDLRQAHQLLAPLLGTALASTAFAIALLCAGQSSTMTGTLAGQIVMEGFLHIRLRPWVRRLLTRSIAIIPAAITIALMGEHGTYDLLILSQVILSLQLPFAIVPLVHFTSDRGRMGQFSNRVWVQALAWLAAGTIIALNVRLVAQQMAHWAIAAGQWGWLVGLLLGLVAGGLGMLLLWLIFHPWVRRLRGLMPAAALTGLGDLPEPRYQRIGVALENLPTDSLILQHAIPLARANQGTLVLIHVVEGVSSQVFGAQAADLEAREDRAYLERVAHELAAIGIKAEVDLRFGSPPAELIAAVPSKQLDLMVLGGHRHKGLADLIFGKTIDPVRHEVPIPIMTVAKPEKPKTGPSSSQS
jgi:manganese transport protein